MGRLRELIDWLAALEAPFAFLLALPFMVAFVGLAGEFVRNRLSRRRQERPSR